jgi:hypothetical protein
MSQPSGGEPSPPMGVSHPPADRRSITDPAGGLGAAPPAGGHGGRAPVCAESAYGSPSDDADTLRPQPREPAPVASQAGADDFAWLYRYDVSASGVRGGDHRTLLLPLDSHPSHPSSYQQVPVALPPPRSRNPVIIMIVLLLCLTTAAVAGLGLLLRSDWRVAAAPASGASSVAEAAPSGAQPSGQVAWLTPTQVSVGCQAPESTDGAGDPVAYVPEQMVDGSMNTAWRCNGNGVGQVVTFGFPAGTTIAEVGLVNGYAKVDPGTGVQRYREYRRIIQVTWTFANGAAFQLSLSDGVDTVQKLSIPPQSGDQVSLTIEASAEPGSTARGRDAVLISEVAFGSPG